MTSPAYAVPCRHCPKQTLNSDGLCSWCRRTEHHDPNTLELSGGMWVRGRDTILRWEPR